MHRSLIALIASVVVLAACSFNRQGVELTGDGGQPDAGMDGGRDAGPPDSGPPDSGPPDSGPPSCIGLYGEAPSFQLCQERTTECEFYMVAASNVSCGDVCSAAGGRCLDAHDNEGGPCGRRTSNNPDCTTLFNDLICVCSRGP
jgi:hypothetical protein